DPRAASPRVVRDGRADAALRAAGVQRRLEPGPRRRCRCRRPRPPARGAALGRRHELHAGARRHQGAAGASRGDPAEACRRVAVRLGRRAAAVDSGSGCPPLLLRFGKTATCATSLIALLAADVLLAFAVDVRLVVLLQPFVAAIAWMLRWL